MGEIVEFASNGKTAEGYLALPATTGPGVVLVQEWWGLNQHIKDVADRFAAEGFVVLAPDVYQGEVTKEPDEALKLLMALDIDRAVRDMSGAVAFLREHDRVAPKKVGSVGFCMGGNLALLLATITKLDATVGFYPAPRTQPEWSKTTAPVQLHIGEHDSAPSPEMAEAIAEGVRSAGQDLEMHIYVGAGHAFFNDTRKEAYKPEAAQQAWERTLTFFRKNLAMRHGNA